MLKIAQFITITFIALPSFARTPAVSEQQAEVKASFATLLKAVEGLTPTEVKDVLTTEYGEDPIYAATPAAAVIAAAAAAAYAGGNVMEASAPEISDKEFDVNFVQF